MSPRTVAAAALVVVTTLAVAGCGGEDDGGKKKLDLDSAKTPAASTGGKTDTSDDAGGPRPGATIGEIEGPDGIVVTLRAAVRDKGGFVTVSGAVANRGTKPYTPLTWRSKETEMKSQSSVSGASLIDAAGKKRYLVLRDTDGECLCTTGLVNIRPGESRALFAQFPAPPDGVRDVDFQLPTMPSVRIKISG
ncbi:hypothetical protein BLA24_26300 [Streptomyces cinnamoneus]|uniref:Secreted protein n=1 Tax=Streptomyces cinnamoneus TaxID=53446 RepID=A0A2G1XE81_STRCJ|nr:hypothetical protein [Streptomyces cinnamoneus]PHQ49543.1 hypothetical protein BLA24_26300 [Streptomyces cinnamoneus]PPT14737.1 hypothetical protein CYQ11_19340 [Streptomyces cinnamoneus]